MMRMTDLILKKETIVGYTNRDLLVYEDYYNIYIVWETLILPCNQNLLIPEVYSTLTTKTCSKF